MNGDAVPYQPTSRDLRWLGLELFSLWRRSRPDPAELRPEVLRELLDRAAGEDRTFEGRRIRELAANWPVEDVRRYVESLIQSYNNVPAGQFDLPGLKEHGLRVDEFIGRGGMGVVHRCWQYNPGRDVAVKFIASDGNESVRKELDERFQAEARILGSLNHECIAHVYLGGSVRDWSGQLLTFIAMELVEGGVLHDVFDAVSHTLHCTIRRCKLFRDICAAVEYAHTKNVLHRDIKPTNILLQGTNEDPLLRKPKLLDFGLAQLVVGDGHDLPLGVSGTPGYRSPAVLRGVEANPARVDIFSLGILLYRIVCGHEPEGLRPSDLSPLQDVSDPNARWIAEAAQVEAYLSRGVRLPKSVAPPSHRLDLESIINRAVNAGSSDAYMSASQLSNDIARFISGRTVTARNRDTRVLRIRRWAARNRSLIAACMLAGLLFMGSGAWYITDQVATARLHVAQAERLLRPIGQNAGAFSEAEIRALRDLADESGKAVRTLFFERVFASTASARQLLNRAPEIEKNGIRLDPTLRAEAHAMLMQQLRTLADNDDAIEERMASVSLGLAIHSPALPQGDEFAMLAIDAIIDGAEDDRVLINDNGVDLGRLARSTAIVHNGDAFERGASLLHHPADVIISLAPALSDSQAKTLAGRFSTLAQSVTNHDLASTCRAFRAVLSRVNGGTDELTNALLDVMVARLSGSSYHDIQDLPEAFKEIRPLLNAEQATSAAKAIASLQYAADDERSSQRLLGRVRILAALSPTDTAVFVGQLSALIPVADEFELASLDDDLVFPALASLDAAGADQVAAKASDRLVSTIAKNEALANHTVRNLSNVLVALAQRLSCDGRSRVDADVRRTLPNSKDRLFGIAQVCKALATAERSGHSSALPDACGARVRELLRPIKWPSFTALIVDLCELIPVQSTNERAVSFAALQGVIPHCDANDLRSIAKAWPHLVASADEGTLRGIEDAMVSRIRMLGSSKTTCRGLASTIDSLLDVASDRPALIQASAIVTDSMLEVVADDNAHDTYQRLEEVSLLWQLLTTAQCDKWRALAAEHITHFSGGTLILSPGSHVLFEPATARGGIESLLASWRGKDRMSFLPQEVQSLAVLSNQITPTDAYALATAMLEDIYRAPWLKRQFLILAFAAIAERISSENLISLYWRPDCTSDAMTVVVTTIGRQAKVPVRATNIWQLTGQNITGSFDVTPSDSK